MRDFRVHLAHLEEPKIPNSVIAGNSLYRHMSAVLEDQRPLSTYAVEFSSVVSQEQWAEMIALNAVLSGVEESTFRTEQRRVLEQNVWGPWARDDVLESEMLELRVAKHRWARSDLAAAIARYHVGYVVVPTGADPDPHIVRNWVDVGSGDWSIWRNPTDHRPN